MKGPPQVHPRSVRGPRKRARRPAGSRFIRGLSLHSAAHPQTRQARPSARAWSVQSDTGYLQRSRDRPWIPWAMRGPDPRPTSDLPWSPTGSSPRTAGHRNQGAKGSVNRPLPLPRPERFAQVRHRAGVHDRGRCPLYVRAQLETAGLPWTQRDLTAPKATAREAGNPQLTGRFRR
jgi:hypothetical protein